MVQEVFDDSAWLSFEIFPWFVPSTCWYSCLCLIFFRCILISSSLDLLSHVVVGFVFLALYWSLWLCFSFAFLFSWFLVPLYRVLPLFWASCSRVLRLCTFYTWNIWFVPRFVPSFNAIEMIVKFSREWTPRQLLGSWTNFWKRLDPRPKPMGRRVGSCL